MFDIEQCGGTVRFRSIGGYLAEEATALKPN